MGKQEILDELNRKKQKLTDRKAYLKELEEKLETLENFSAQCADRIKAFENSMSRRKTKLLSLGDILSRVKSALHYNDKMGQLLNGREYEKTVESISSLQTSVSAKKRDIIRDIQETEKQIDQLNRDIRQLQYAYNTYPEEVENDG